MATLGNWPLQEYVYFKKCVILAKIEWQNCLSWKPKFLLIFVHPVTMTRFICTKIIDNLGFHDKQFSDLTDLKVDFCSLVLQVSIT